MCAEMSNELITGKVFNTPYLISYDLMIITQDILSDIKWLNTVIIKW